jgi:hypothetical protein
VGQSGDQSREQDGSHDSSPESGCRQLLAADEHLASGYFFPGLVSIVTLPILPVKRSLPL